MKLRIRGNSLRLRLKRSEVDRIGAGEAILDATRFPGAVLSYSLRVSSDARQLVAALSGSDVVVTVPASEAKRWASTDDVSLTGSLDLPGGDALAILIEKDFACLTPGHGRSHEDDEDAFPHPEAPS